MLEQLADAARCPVSTWDDEAPTELPSALGALSGVMCPSCPATELRWEAAHTALVCPVCAHWQPSPRVISDSRP